MKMTGATMTNPPKLRLLKGSSLSSLDIPPRKPLLGDWLTERHPCMVYAQTGRGKSLFAMSIAIAVAGGGNVFGWSAPEPRPVLYVDGEMDVADAKERDNLLIPAVDGLDRQAVEANCTILSRHHQLYGAVFPDLVDEAGQEALMTLVEKLKPAFVVLDNLSCLAEIRDENDAASFTPVLNMLARLRRAECAVLVIHHTGKQEGKYRGSSKLAANFESILQLASNPDLMSGDTGFTIKVDKCRSGKQPKPLKVSLEVDPETGAGRWCHEELRNRHLEEIVKAVCSREFNTGKELAVHLGISTGELSKRKRKAVALGLITEAEWKQCLQDARDTSREFDDPYGPEGFDVGDDGEGEDHAA